MRKIFDHERIYNTYVGHDIQVCVISHWSNNMHVLTPRAELLKIFDIASPRFIRFKKNSSVCLVVSDSRSKVYVFQDL